MRIVWTITKDKPPGNAWFVRREVWRDVITGDTDLPYTLKLQRTSTDPRIMAFKSLSQIRDQIAEETRPDKRVRFTKHSDEKYTYTFTVDA
jgi:ribosomal protein L18